MTQSPAPVFLGCSKEDAAKRLLSAISPQYGVRHFTDGADLVRALNDDAPQVVLITEGLRPAGAINCVREIRSRDEFNFLPILFIGHSQDRISARRAVNDGASAYVWAGADGRQVCDAVRRAINKRIEDNWEGLADTPRQALKATLKTINRAYEIIQSDGILDVSQVENDCRPLVDSVVEGDIATLLNAVKDYDDDTYVHSLRVGAFLAWFGYSVGLRDAELSTLATGGLLHDIGKLNVSTAIINKPGRLDPQEMATVRKHVETAMPVLERAKNVSNGVRIICRNHHERLDGSGYPYGLKADEIDQLSRMAAIVDVFSAITDHRPYRQPQPFAEACDLLRADHHQFDQRLAESFRTLVLSPFS